MGSPENSVVAFHQKLAAAWSANDGTAFAAFFAEDGSLINPFGERADGREALTAMYSEYFGGMLKGTTTSIRSLTHLRAIEPDHVFADAEQTIYAANGDVLDGSARRQSSAGETAMTGGWLTAALPHGLPPPA